MAMPAGQPTFMRETKKDIDQSTVMKAFGAEFEEKWNDIEYRFKVVPGKEFISILSTKTQAMLVFSTTIAQLTRNIQR